MRREMFRVGQQTSEKRDRTTVVKRGRRRGDDLAPRSGCLLPVLCLLAACLSTVARSLQKGRPLSMCVIVVGSPGLARLFHALSALFPLPHHSIPHRLLTHSTPGEVGDLDPSPFLHSTHHCSACPTRTRTNQKTLREAERKPSKTRSSWWHDGTNRGSHARHCLHTLVRCADSSDEGGSAINS